MRLTLLSLTLFSRTDLPMPASQFECKQNHYDEFGSITPNLSPVATPIANCSAPPSNVAFIPLRFNQPSSQYAEQISKCIMKGKKKGEKGILKELKSLYKGFKKFMNMAEFFGLVTDVTGYSNDFSSFVPTFDGCDC